MQRESMTRKIFWEDPYKTDLDTIVTSVEGLDITLAETIFFAFSGGQESDSGTIGGFRVLKASRQEKEIRYTLEDDHRLKPGDAVKIHVDWDRRYKLMKLHFAAELVLELMNRRLPGIVKIGAHIAEDKSRVDFSWEDNFTSMLPGLAAEIKAIIDSNREIISDFSDREKERRFWSIEGFAQVPCGGTHLKRTEEIGDLTLKRNNIGRAKERIEIRLLPRS
jgi:Ser-tRNA(Ala) deacylase AlaX